MLDGGIGDQSWPLWVVYWQLFIQKCKIIEIPAPHWHICFVPLASFTLAQVLQLRQPRFNFELGDSLLLRVRRLCDTRIAVRRIHKSDVLRPVRFPLQGRSWAIGSEVVFWVGAVQALHIALLCCLALLSEFSHFCSQNFVLLHWHPGLGQIIVFQVLPPTGNLSSDLRIGRRFLKLNIQAKFTRLNGRMPKPVFTTSQSWPSKVFKPTLFWKKCGCSPAFFNLYRELFPLSHKACMPTGCCGSGTVGRSAPLSSIGFITMDFIHNDCTLGLWPGVQVPQCLRRLGTNWTSSVHAGLCGEPAGEEWWPLTLGGGLKDAVAFSGNVVLDKFVPIGAVLTIGSFLYCFLTLKFVTFVRLWALILIQRFDQMGLVLTSWLSECQRSYDCARLFGRLQQRLL